MYYNYVRCYHCGELGEGDIFFTTFCDSVIISKENFFLFDGISLFISLSGHIQNSLILKNMEEILC
uniref:Uncharacterized protein n=1 Tax=Piliocolobus tephrosceles TaxID=591936 RepID=A0A8C9I5E4_9PRIM